MEIHPTLIHILWRTVGHVGVALTSAPTKQRSYTSIYTVQYYLLVVVTAGGEVADIPSPANH